jgi:hypothetical protein
VQAITFGEGFDRAKYLSVADDKPTPSLASVPFPNSSIKHKDLQHQQTICKPIQYHNDHETRFLTNLLVERRSILLI